MPLSPEQLKTKKFWDKHPKLITREIRDIIHGYMLSDGSIEPGGALQVMQSLAQEKWVQWMYEELKTLRTSTRAISHNTITDDRTGKETYSVRFNTRSFLKGFRSMWYVPDLIRSTKTGQKNFRKVLPKSINAILCPNVLTLWYAGDGSKIRGSLGAKIEATAFTAEERLILQSVLLRKLQLDVKINKAGTSKSGTDQYTLNFNAATYLEFRKCTSKFDLIQRLFPYKLHPIHE
jgi:hypothetical protein